MKYKRLTALLSASILLLSGCSGLPRERSQTYTDTLFDTVISVQIFDSVDEDVLEGCEKLCKKYDSMFSNKIEDSEISRINSAGGNPVEVSKETIKLIKKGIYYSEMSDGVFDITIAPVSNLWDFKAETPLVPSPEAIAEAVSHVNYENIIIRDNTVKLTDPHAGIDLGAIAKGYIADRIKDYLEEEGVRHAMINLGGNVLAMGSKLDGSDYNIGIQEPFDETGEPITSVKISDKSVVTSGIYQRYFKADGKIYHHILDPNTGYPCENNLYSVTILTDSSLTADALSTTCFLLGYDRGMKLINQLDNVDAVFITNDNQIH
ncbi:FAD:protein FMN transferase [[Clostridium] scindens]